MKVLIFPFLLLSAFGHFCVYAFEFVDHVPLQKQVE